MNSGAIKTLKSGGAFVLLAMGLGCITMGPASAQSLAMDGDGEETEEMALSDTLNTDVFVEISRTSYDYIPDVSYDEVGARIASLNATVAVPYNARVKGFVDYFAIRNRDYTRTMLKRRDIYFPLFEKYLAKYGMPDDLKYLSIVESGLNPKAMSRVGAAGLWQFMPSTGRIYRLNQNWYVDERLDPEKATEAACRYLKQLHGMFNDWQLALAAYNAGPGNVNKAIRRSGGKKDFWEVYNYLPRETRSYVPQFAAVMYVMNFAEEHNLLPEEHEYQYAQQVDTVHLNRFVSLEALEDQLNLCRGELEFINPELVRKAIPDNAGTYALRVPVQVKSYFASNRLAILDSTTAQSQALLAYNTRNEVGSTYNRERISYRVQRGDNLGKIASSHNVSVADLKKWNRMSGTTIHAGQRLAIYVSPNQKNSINNQLASTQNSSRAVAVIKGNVYYVQPGDTLWEISKKHGGLSVAEIKKLNNLNSNQIKVGQKLIIAK